jgi:superfamily I DNA and/or RNA helicase
MDTIRLRENDIKKIETALEYRFLDTKTLIVQINRFLYAKFKKVVILDKINIKPEKICYDEETLKLKEQLEEDLFFQFYVDIESPEEINILMKKYLENGELLRKLSEKLVLFRELFAIDFSELSLEYPLFILSAVRNDVFQQNKDVKNYRLWLMKFISEEKDSADDLISSFTTMKIAPSQQISSSKPMSNSESIISLPEPPKALKTSSFVVEQISSKVSSLFLTETLSFEQHLFNIFRDPFLPVTNLQRTLFPLPAVSDLSPEVIKHRFYEQFIPFIFEEIRSQICNQLELIERKQLKYFSGIRIKPPKTNGKQSFFLDGEGDDDFDFSDCVSSDKELVTMYIQSFSTDLPKLDHGFHLEVIALVLPSTTKGTESKTTSNFVFGIAKEIVNDGKVSKLQIIFSKRDYEKISRLHSTFTETAQSHNAPKYHFYWLCGLIPSERMFQICLRKPAPAILQQLISFQFPVWSSLLEGEENVSMHSKRMTSFTPSKPLNGNQYEMIQKLLLAIQRRKTGFYFIQGPPGTGKTTVVIELIAQMIQRFPSQRILITAPTNQAIINIIQKMKFHPFFNQQKQSPIPIALFGTGKGKNSQNGKETDDDNKTDLREEFQDYSIRDFLLLQLEKLKQMKLVLKTKLFPSGYTFTSTEKKSTTETTSDEKEEPSQEKKDITKQPIRRKQDQRGEEGELSKEKGQNDFISQFIEYFQKEFSVISSRVEKKCFLENLAFAADMKIDLKKKINDFISQLSDKLLNIVISNERDCENLLNEIISLIEKIMPDFETYYLFKSQIIFTTLISAGKMKLQKLFNASLVTTPLSGTTPILDCVIVDEAAQALLPELLIPLSFSPKYFICIGDPNQLPATVMSNVSRSLGYNSSLMHWVSELQGRDKEKKVDPKPKGNTVEVPGEINPTMVMLSEQYRMDSVLCEFPSKQFYQNRLLTSSEVVARPSILPNPSHDLPSSLQYPNLIFQTSGKEMKNSYTKSYYNEEEAEGIVSLVKYLLLEKHFQPTDIGIITFYSAQIELISVKLKEKLTALVKEGVLAENQSNRILKELTISTVDGFQGDERNIILISMVRTATTAKNNSGNSASIGFLNDFRRLNVAFTRAKYARWIFCSVDALRDCNVEDVRSFMKEMISKKNILEERSWKELLLGILTEKKEVVTEKLKEETVHCEKNSSKEPKYQKYRKNNQRMPQKNNNNNNSSKGSGEDADELLNGINSLSLS